TPLHCAVFGRRKGVVQLLLKNGADVKARSCSDATPLFWACDRGYLDMVKLLVDNAAEVNGRAMRRMTWGPSVIHSWTNLHMAAHAGHADVVEYLLNKGADIHARCTRGDEYLTPLHLAARNGRVDVVRRLLAKGADANLKSKEGRTALDFAREKNHPEVVELLRKHGAKE
ncbi:MAG: ankyrin repeat domain-containing protein, partial [Sedimentisphaerales bacterium]